MPVTSILKTLTCGDSSLKLIYAVSAQGKDHGEDNRDELCIPNFVKVGLNCRSIICEDTGECKFQFNITLESDSLDIYRNIKTNISSNDLNYRKTGFCAPDEWSHWETMGYIKPTINTVKENITGAVYTAAIDLCITAYEVIKMDTISSKLYTDKDFTNFFLCAIDGKVAVHREYLGAHSDVFKAMLKGEWKETVEGQIKLKGVTVQTLEDLKVYMYLGIVPDDGLQPLLLVARCYLIKELENHCIRKLAETVMPKDLFSLLEFACVNNIPELTYKMLQITAGSTVNNALQFKSKDELEK